MAETGYQFLIRAHEVKQQGLRLCQSGKVVTVFTSSAYCGGDNAAGAIYIANRKLRMISCLTQISRAKGDDASDGGFGTPTPPVHMQSLGEDSIVPA